MLRFGSANFNIKYLQCWNLLKMFALHCTGKKPATPAVSEDCKNFKRDLNSTRWNTEGSASDYFPPCIFLKWFHYWKYWWHFFVQQSSLSVFLEKYSIFRTMTALNDKAEVSAEKETRNIDQIDWWWAISKFSSRWWMATLLLTLHYWCEVWGTPHRLSSKPDDDPWCLV